MKKLVLLLAVVAMIIAPAIGFGQLTTQDRDQLSLINSGIYYQSGVVKQLQDKVLYVGSLKEEFKDLNHLDSISKILNTEGLSVTQRERMEKVSFFIKKFETENPNIEECLLVEEEKLSILKDRKYKITLNACLNDNIPVEMGNIEKWRRNRASNVIEKSSKARLISAEVDHKVWLLKESEKNQVSSEKGTYTLLIENRSANNARKFSITGETTGETNTYVLEPGESLVISVLPQKYFCDITDLFNFKTSKENFANIGVNSKCYVKGKSYSGFFIAPQYLR